MDDADVRLRDEFLHIAGHGVDRLDPVMEKKYLTVAGQFVPDGIPNGFFVELQDIGLDGLPIFGRCVDDRQIADSHQRQMQRTGNRRGRQSEHIDQRP
ncbi:MAG: hypothetical protein A4E66_02069 [Syntrophus sp. PtaB.Bin001]|nr:MAG: hypothetical protein A4E66_02069 [Syntrophus sp. PtaB.Bin001]